MAVATVSLYCAVAKRLKKGGGGGIIFADNISEGEGIGKIFRTYHFSQTFPLMYRNVLTFSVVFGKFSKLFARTITFYSEPLKYFRWLRKQFADKSENSLAKLSRHLLSQLKPGAHDAILVGR
jgi:hypothetical protein